MFDNTFKAFEDRLKWFGPDGISKQIKNTLNINHGTNIFYIFQEVIDHKKWEILHRKHQTKAGWTRYDSHQFH
jgi:hypothetical protein